MHIVSFAVDILLAGYVIWQCARFLPAYRQLKEALAKGDRQARLRLYRKAIVFEWISALLALFALGFDWSKLNPRLLSLGGTWLGQLVAQAQDFDRGTLIGVFGGVAVGTIALSFRGWLLSTLHGPLGLSGSALLLIAAAIFGLAHAYQGITGVILAALAGALFCALYIATGSLLVPMVLHVVVDLRFAALPGIAAPIQSEARA
jgi:membrane protease YdiL (CAAX protease family)